MDLNVRVGKKKLIFFFFGKYCFLYINYINEYLVIVVIFYRIYIRIVRFVGYRYYNFSLL